MEKNRLIIQKENIPPEKKRYVSTLGDSFSTLAGWNPDGYCVYYQGDVCERLGVSEYADTWWGQVTDNIGGRLLTNNSWSGSRVTQLPRHRSLFPSGCSDERILSLSSGGKKPDIILVMLGSNDLGYGVELFPPLCSQNGGITVRSAECGDESYFSVAYDIMLKKLRANYPDAFIGCCTLFACYYSFNPKMHFPDKESCSRYAEYNSVIRKTAAENGCSVIDIDSYCVSVSSGICSHPDHYGMQTIAKIVTRELLGEEADFLDCCGSHAYFKIMSESHRDMYVCGRCCKKTAVPFDREKS